MTLFFFFHLRHRHCESLGLGEIPRQGEGEDDRHTVARGDESRGQRGAKGILFQRNEMDMKGKIVRKGEESGCGGINVEWGWVGVESAEQV